MTTIDNLIANKLFNELSERENGTFTIEVEVNHNTIIEVDGWFQVEARQEDDYYTGTGAWVTDFVSVLIDDCNVWAYDDEGNEIESSLTPNVEAIEKEVEEALY